MLHERHLTAVKQLLQQFDDVYHLSAVQGDVDNNVLRFHILDLKRSIYLE